MLRTWEAWFRLRGRNEEISRWCMGASLRAVSHGKGLQWVANRLEGAVLNREGRETELPSLFSAKPI